MKLSLKTLISQPSEIPFLWMMFEEAASYVDRIIVTEFDVTHSGQERALIFGEHLERFSSAFPQLTYLPGKSVQDIRRNATTSEDHHHNETVMRGWFARQLDFERGEVVVATDGDEVLYSSTYRWIHDRFAHSTRGARLRLHHFVYRPNYLWVNREFMAPSALAFHPTNKREYPSNWRYQGEKVTGYWGCHFSWCMPVEDMVRKVSNYSHAPEQAPVGKRKTFEQAVELKSWPFDDRPTQIEEISYNSPLLPLSFWRYAHLIDPSVLGPSWKATN